MNVKFVFRITALSVFITSLFMLVPAFIAFIDSQMHNSLVYLGVMCIMLLFSLVVLIFTKNYKQKLSEECSIRKEEDLFNGLPEFNHPDLVGTAA